MVKAAIADGRPRTVTFLNDMMGQGIKRDEKDALSGGDPHEATAVAFSGGTHTQSRGGCRSGGFGAVSVCPHPSRQPT